MWLKLCKLHLRFYSSILKTTWISSLTSGPAGLVPLNGWLEYYWACCGTRRIIFCLGMFPKHMVCALAETRTVKCFSSCNSMDIWGKIFPTWSWKLLHRESLLQKSFPASSAQPHHQKNCHQLPTSCPATGNADFI